MKKIKWWNKKIGMVSMMALLLLFSWKVQAEEQTGQPAAQDVTGSSEAGDQTVEEQREEPESLGQEDQNPQNPQVPDPAEVERERTYKGWVKKESGWYYYAVQGQKYTGWLFDGGNWFYLDGSDREFPGRMAASGDRNIDGKYYVFHASGAMQTGWQLLGENWFYHVKSGERAAGWMLDMGIWYYLDGQDPAFPGRMLKSEEKQIGEAYYRFQGNGSMRTGWHQEPEGWYYYRSSGAKILKGWEYISGRWYYFLEESGGAHKGLMLWKDQEEIEGQTYYFDAAGAMRTGWVNKGEDWYYLRESGVAASGWMQSAGLWYYLNPENGNKMEKNGWKVLSGNYYYFHASGAMAEGWIHVGGEWYYLFPGDGRMATGWQQIRGYWYYMYYEGDGYGFGHGTMAKNRNIGSDWVDAMGRWVPSYLQSMQVRANGYSSPTPYLILVDCSANKVAIFQGSQGNWSNIQYWDCASGAPGTPTVKGVFQVGIKGHHFDSGGVRLYWYTQIYGDYLFHSLPYLKTNGRLWDSRLGIGTSHGCVRLPIEQAKWIYDVIPRGTTVVTY